MKLIQTYTHIHLLKKTKWFRFKNLDHYFGLKQSSNEVDYVKAYESMYDFNDIPIWLEKGYLIKVTNETI